MIDLGSDYMTGAITKAHEASDMDRPEGLHLSQIIQDIVRTMHPGWFTELENDRRRALFELGNTFEDVMAEALRARLGLWHKPKPIVCEGIICSPDGWSPTRNRLDEVKLTWCSSKDGLAHPKLQKYMYQVLAYCHALKARRARLHVFYINGDWKPPLPQPHTYLIIPSMQDILANWKLLTQHARDKGWL